MRTRTPAGPAPNRLLADLPDRAYRAVGYRLGYRRAKVKERPMQNAGATQSGRRPLPAVTIRWPAVAGNCKGAGDGQFPSDPEPTRKGAPRAKSWEIAKSRCVGCPILGKCREAGRTEEHGVWGGETPQERQKRQRHAPEVFRRIHLVQQLPGHSIREIAEQYDLGGGTPMADALRVSRARRLCNARRRGAA
jgi:hypothetical protein